MSNDNKNPNKSSRETFPKSIDNLVKNLNAATDILNTDSATSLRAINAQRIIDFKDNMALNEQHIIDFKDNMVDPKELYGINELMELLVKQQSESITKQNEVITQQSKTIESLAEIINQNNHMITDSAKESKEARVYAIISIFLSIIAIVISIVLG